VTTSRNLARAGIIVSGAFLIARVLGFVRTFIIVRTFSAGPELDEFFAAFRIPDLIFQLVAAGALSSALIPVVSGLLSHGEERRAWHVVSTVINLLLIGLLVLGILAFIFAPIIVPFITPGFDQPGRWERTIELTRIMLLSPIFLAMGAVASSLLNAKGRFAASAIAPIVYNLAIIGGALLLSSSLGVTGLAISVVAGSVAHLLVQIPNVRAIGFRYTPAIDTGDEAARRSLTLMAPRALGLGATQITFVVMTSLATTLQVGALTIFNTAFTLLQIPIGLIGVPLGIVVLPSLSREVALGRTTEFAALVSRALRVILFVMLPLTGISLVLRRDIVELLFGFGDFDAADIDATSMTFAAFLVGLGAHALIAILARAFYAQQDTRTPVAAAIMAVALNTTLAVLLVGPFGLAGLALAIAVAAWAETVVLFALLARRVPELALGPIISLGIRTLIVAVVASLAAALAAQALTTVVGVDPTRIGLLVRMVGATLVWAVVAVAASLALRIDELRSIVGLMVAALPRLRRS
jgi:putative peptidoglycan lipid II flippase